MENAITPSVLNPLEEELLYFFGRTDYFATASNLTVLAFLTDDLELQVMLYRLRDYLRDNFTQTEYAEFYAALHEEIGSKMKNKMRWLEELRRYKLRKQKNMPENVNP